MISVAMATYNGERFIKEQLLSILNQTVLPDEVIIGDDNSCDGTREIIESIVDLHPKGSAVRFVQFNERAGYPGNFIRTIELCKGDLILLSDQDDVWYPTKIESIREQFASNDIGVLISKFDIIDEQGRMDHKIQGKGTITPISYKRFIRHPKYPGMAMALKRRYWEEACELFKDHMVSHDWAINYCATLHNDFYELNISLCAYRQHDRNVTGMVTKQKKENALEQRIKTVKQLRDNLNSVPQKNLFIQDDVEFQNRRIEYLKCHRAKDLFWHDVRHPEYISFRSIAGDIYALR